MNFAVPSSTADVPAFEVHGLTHRGLVRERNEDTWFADARFGLALAADGVGGHASGAQASQAVAATIAEYLRRAARILKVTERAQQTASDFFGQKQVREEAVRRAIQFCHRRLLGLNAGIDEPRQRGGSTLVGIWAPLGLRSFATVFHVGDSRLYVLRNQELMQLTRDHSAYEKWRESGKTTNPPPKNYILQAMGISQTVLPDIHSFRLYPQDRLLICTDGLSFQAGDKEIIAAISRTQGLRVACDELIQFGLSHDGKDNLTAVLCSFD
ncbi:MAG: serine/threonine-protein phosphatase [Proteobacteria bacterium]|nr:serine/threonine-protein phosphatase [Pseudomonadota bacterium]